MDETTRRRLRFRRQFLITNDSEAVPLPGWRELSIAPYRLLYHPDLEVHQASAAGRTSVLLGHVHDDGDRQKTNAEIARELAQAATFLDMIRRTDPCCGSFVMLRLDRGRLRIAHDASGLREVYYRSAEHLHCASTPDLIAAYVPCQRQSGEEVSQLLESAEFAASEKTWVGTASPYRDVFRLSPNFWLDAETGRQSRFFGHETACAVTLDRCADRMAELLSGFMKSAHRRHQVKIGLTAGWDSRLLLATSREIRDDLDCYLYLYPHLGHDHPDVTVPRRLAARAGFRFRVEEPSGKPLDPVFERIFFSNHVLARPHRAVRHHDAFLQGLDQTLAVSGNVAETFKCTYRLPGKATAEKLAQKLGYARFPYAVRQIGRWLEETRAVCRRTGIDVGDLFYLEQRSGTWGALAASEERIVRESLCPFNCRELLWMAMKLEDRWRAAPESMLSRAVIERSWPQLLAEPVNPSSSSTSPHRRSRRGV